MIFEGHLTALRISLRNHRLLMINYKIEILIKILDANYFLN